MKSTDQNNLLQQVQNIQMQQYGYDLPDERIAKYPLSQRDLSKLLVYKPLKPSGERVVAENAAQLMEAGAIHTAVFKELPTELPAGACLVFNNTKVIQARMEFHKSTGSRIEVFCLEPLEPAQYELVFQQTHTCTWKCMIGNAKKWKEAPLEKSVNWQGQTLTVQAERLAIASNTSTVRFTWNLTEATFADVLDAFGELPIPPYLHRKTEESDKTTYQTVYSKIKGSVAAPTAGLHFTPAVLQDLDDKGFQRCEITLHVGAGTFQPVKSAEIGGHAMHEEVIDVPLARIQQIQQSLGKVIAVGTTSVRTLESLYFIGCHLAAGQENWVVEQWEPYTSEHPLSTFDALQAIIDYLQAHGLQELQASTRIIIVPGYQFHIVHGLITNFHQPHSTLLLLLAAFVGDAWHQIYEYALAQDYRFLSYGDSSLLLPNDAFA